MMIGEALDARLFMDELLRKANAKEVRMTSYPRLFTLMRDRSDNARARLGHVADGIEWTPGGQVSLRWKGPHISIATFNTMDAMKEVHGYRNVVTGNYDTRVVYLNASKPLDRRLVEAIDHLYYALGDYIDRTQKQAHVARTDLQRAFGAVQDLMMEGSKPRLSDYVAAHPTNTCA